MICHSIDKPEVVLSIENSDGLYIVVLILTFHNYSWLLLATIMIFYKSWLWTITSPFKRNESIPLK